MSTFSSLLKHRKGHPPGEAQTRAHADFPGKVARSRLKLRRPGEPILATGRHFIVGVATYSAAELDLLDQLEEAAAELMDVEVFDVLNCKQRSDFDRFIPGIDNVSRTPIIGVISDGSLVDQATGLPDVVATLQRFHVLNGIRGG